MYLKYKKLIYGFITVCIFFSISISPLIGDDDVLTNYNNHNLKTSQEISYKSDQLNTVSAGNSFNSKNIKIDKANSYWTKLFKSVGPKSVQVTKKTVKSKGRCSCGKKGSYGYYSTQFKNNCPYCKKNKVLGYEQGKTCPEGMWVCKRCDADFCLVTGREHITSNKAKFLKKEKKKKVKTTKKTSSKKTK